MISLALPSGIRATVDPRGATLVDLWVPDREGRLDDMVRHYEEAGRLAPDNPELLFWAGMAASYTGDRERGLGLVERAIAASPGLRTLLERLTSEVAPGAESVRRDLESRYNS